MHPDDVTPKFKAIAERDIDLLLMEEFESGSGFMEWFINKTACWTTDGLKPLGTYHSVSNDLGESDLLVLALESNGRRLALLIENKVDAPPQPDQAKRYEQRGELGLKAGSWQLYTTCIVAPRRYLNNITNAAGYQSRISYEEIAEWVSANRPLERRTKFKCDLIQAAIDQERRGYSGTVDPVVTKFFTEFWEYAESLFQELRFQNSGPRASASTWAVLRPQSLPKGRSIVLKVIDGYVDLQFAGFGDQVENLIRLNPLLISDNLGFVRATKSAALRITVAGMDVRGDFTAQRDIALSALKAAYKLLKISPLVVLK